MSMNREQKRLLQRQGEVDADGEPIRQRREQSSHQAEERTSVAQFSREVRAELRKGAWPGVAVTCRDRQLRNGRGRHHRRRDLHRVRPRLDIFQLRTQPV